MSPQRLVALTVFVVMLVSGGYAQVNEISGTVGRTFVSSQRIEGANFFNPNIHFGNGLTFAGNYSRLLKSHGIFGISAELPVAISFDMDLNTGANVIPESYKSLFITPSVRVNFFNEQSFSLWLSAGGGYGLFKQSHDLLFGGHNPGELTTNTGVFQFGTGVDVFPWSRWGFRMEARDFYSGVPDLNVTTVRSHQHNIYVGGGVLRRF